MWIAYPHARREMVRELAFIAPCGILGWLGGELAHKLAVTVNPDPFLPPIEAHMPLWLAALGAVLLGYLIGGGVVWIVRIFGSLAFGKEALGLGDVHMMAAVGSVCGWIDATLAFFVAAFVGLAWFFVSLAFGGKVKRTLPYGPYLAVATVLVLLCKPLIEMLLNWIMQSGAGVAPINLP
jgi:leader peptidase (prepilin peptidase)/N-methyltransferase